MSNFLVGEGIRNADASKNERPKIILDGSFRSVSLLLMCNATLTFMVMMMMMMGAVTYGAV